MKDGGGAFGWLLLFYLVVYAVMAILLAAKLSAAAIHRPAMIEVQHVTFDNEDAREDER